VANGCVGYLAEGRRADTLATPLGSSHDLYRSNRSAVPAAHTTKKKMTLVIPAFLSRASLRGRECRFSKAALVAQRGPFVGACLLAGCRRRPTCSESGRLLRECIQVSAPPYGRRVAPARFALGNRAGRSGSEQFIRGSGCLNLPSPSCLRYARPLWHLLWEVCMLEEVSRRRLFGWLAAAAIAVTAPALVASDPAEAQTVGMERRQSRRQGRRMGRRMRRLGRRAARASRRAGRRGVM